MAKFSISLGCIKGTRGAAFPTLALACDPRGSLRLRKTTQLLQSVCFHRPQFS
jgi:hypothetical protein